MAALTAERKYTRLPIKGPGGFRDWPLAGGVKAWKGGIACLDQSTGFVKPGETETGLVAVGLFDETMDNTDGADGDVRVGTRDDGAFSVGNSSGADQIAKADAGKIAYVVDDQTVALTDGTGTRSGAVTIRDVSDGKVFVKFDNPTPPE